jgi:hypothetical protein
MALFELRIAFMTLWPPDAPAEKFIF